MAQISTEHSEDEPAQASLIEHLTELRQRLIFCIITLLLACVGCYLISDYLFAWLAEPLEQAFGESDQRRLIFTGLPEAFFTKIKLSFYAGLMLAFPIMAVQFYLFMAPGLYKQEKHVLLPYLMMAPLLFAGGILLAYYYIFPMAWKFFISFEQEAMAGLGLPVMLEARVGEYLSLVMQILFAFGFAFQLPILLTLMVRVGLISTEALRRGRRYAAVIIVTIAAIITPPDVISQIGLFLALYLLYELSIITGKWVESHA